MKKIIADFAQCRSSMSKFFCKYLVAMPLFLALGIGVSGCAQQSFGAVPIITVMELKAHPLYWNGKIIDLQGYVEVNRTSNPLAFPPLPRLFGARLNAVVAHKDDSGKNVKKAIDLVISSKAITKKLESFHEVSCVVLRGKFTAYHGMVVGMGNFESDTGVIKVVGIRKCGRKR